MIGTILGLLIVGLIGGLIGGLMVMVATKIVFKKSVGFGQSFKIAFISIIIAGIINLLVGAALGPDQQLLSGGLGLLVGFGVMTFVIDQQLGVGLAKAAIVAGIVYAIYFVLMLVFMFVIVGVILAAGGADAINGTNATPPPNLLFPG
jgi:hypothetical protein